MLNKRVTKGSIYGTLPLGLRCLWAVSCDCTTQLLPIGIGAGLGKHLNKQALVLYSLPVCRVRDVASACCEQQKGKKNPRNNVVYGDFYFGNCLKFWCRLSDLN